MTTSFDVSGGVFWVLVLPEDDHLAAQVLPVLDGLGIAFLVALDLVCPPLGMGFGGLRVLRAAVPEAAVDHHDAPGFLDDEIPVPAECRVRSGAYRELDASS